MAPIAAGAASARRTMEAVRSFDPDLIHLHEPAVPGPNLPILLGFKGPMLGTFHIAGDMPQRWIMPAVKLIMQRVHARVAVSEAARDTTQAVLGGDYTVLWNGIDVERFEHGPTEPSTRPAVLFVGRHERRKGLEVLLEAWRGLDRDAVLWVVGTGPQTTELQARHVADVEWLGVVSDGALARRLRGATALCAPAIGGESFGIVLLEAMAAGTAIVASDIDGYRNVARPGVEAVVAPPGDHAALRESLRRVLDDALLRAELVDAGERRATHFSLRKLAEAYVDLYHHAMALV
jgi:phosphatidylinositol alpha-mannosyltransferase